MKKVRAHHNTSAEDDDSGRKTPHHENVSSAEDQGNGLGLDVSGKPEEEQHIVMALPDAINAELIKPNLTTAPGVSAITAVLDYYMAMSCLPSTVLFYWIQYHTGLFSWCLYHHRRTW